MRLSQQFVSRDVRPYSLSQHVRYEAQSVMTRVLLSLLRGNLVASKYLSLM
jgi:hypothetical protein